MSSATVTTGAGNDFIFTMDGDDWISADMNGVKAIYDKGPGTDVVDVFLGYFEVKLTMINSDLYITNKYSAYSPVEDPNAIILMDHSFTDGQSIEYLRTAGGWLVELSSLWSAQSPMQSGADVAVQSAQAGYASDVVMVSSAIAASFAAGTVLAAAAGATESIPEHLRYLVGGATTMTTFDLVGARVPDFGGVDDNVFASGEPVGYPASHTVGDALLGDLYLAQVAYA